MFVALVAEERAVNGEKPVGWSAVGGQGGVDDPIAFPVRLHGKGFGGGLVYAGGIVEKRVEGALGDAFAVERLPQRQLVHRLFVRAQGRLDQTGAGVDRPFKKYAVLVEVAYRDVQGDRLGRQRRTGQQGKEERKCRQQRDHSLFHEGAPFTDPLEWGQPCGLGRCGAAVQIEVRRIQYKIDCLGGRDGRSGGRYAGRSAHTGPGSR